MGRYKQLYDVYIIGPRLMRSPNILGSAAKSFSYSSCSGERQAHNTSLQTRITYLNNRRTSFCKPLARVTKLHLQVTSCGFTEKRISQMSLERSICRGFSQAPCSESIRFTQHLQAASRMVAFQRYIRGAHWSITTTRTLREPICNSTGDGLSGLGSKGWTS